MRALLLCFGLACCAEAQPPVIETIYVTAEPVAAPHPAPFPLANVQAAAVVRKERHLVAEAGRYTVWKQSKPPIISHLASLMATAKFAVQQLQDAKTLRDRAAALPAAEAAVEALSVYLQTKGD
jgi:hypothetical protein